MKITLFESAALSVFDYRCTMGPDDKPFPEQHTRHSLSYVRKGSFGYDTRGRSHELVAGAVMLGHGGDEYTCSHPHHICGDECLSFQLVACARRRHGCPQGRVADWLRAADT